jgi:hypothetical protein
MAGAVIRALPQGEVDGGPAELLRSSGELAARRERWR